MQCDEGLAAECSINLLSASSEIMAGFESAAAKLSPDAREAQLLQYRLGIVWWVSISFFTIVLWDMLVTRLYMELKLVYFPEIRSLRQQKRPTPKMAAALLLLNRLIALVTIISSFFLQRQPPSCQLSLTVSASGFALGTGCCLSIFVHRTIALRRSKWPVQLFLWLNVGGITGLWLYWALAIKISQ